MGGHAAGGKASKIAVEKIVEYLQKAPYPNIPQALNGALQYANQQILIYAAEHPEARGMGTTACVLLIQDEQAWIAHAGDSRIYLYLGNERQLHRITKDHSFVQTLVDMGQITDDEAERHPNKNRVLKVLGAKPDLQSEISDPIHPKKGDVFLICSDGLSGMVNDLNMEGILTKDTPIAEKGNELIQMAMNKGGVDNITLQLIEISQSPYKMSEFVSKNPKERQFTPISSTKKKKKLIILLGALVIVFAGGLFIYNNNDRCLKMRQDCVNEKLKTKIDSFNEKTHQIDSLNKIVKDIKINRDIKSEIKAKQIPSLEKDTASLATDIKQLRKDSTNISNKRKRLK
jgi:protein phosphatase